MSTTIALHANLVLLAHPLISLFFSGILMLHEFPPLDISVHLIHSARFDGALFLDFLLISLLSIMFSKVFGVTVEWARKVRRFRVRVVQLSIINELMVDSDVLSHPLLVLDVFTGLLCAHP